MPSEPERTTETHSISLHHGRSTACTARHNELLGTGFGDRFEARRGVSGSFEEQLGGGDEAA
jgi:hypothetical protein